MISIRQIQAENALTIAKLLLLRTKMFELQFDPEQKFDLIAFNKSNPEQVLAIEVKATKKPKNELESYARMFQRKCSKSDIPILMMFVNYDEIEKGWYTLNYDNVLLHSLKLEDFANSIQSVFNTEYTKSNSPIQQAKFYNNALKKQISRSSKSKSLNKNKLKQAQSFVGGKVLKKNKVKFKLASSKPGKIRNPRLKKA